MPRIWRDDKVRASLAEAARAGGLPESEVSAYVERHLRELKGEDEADYPHGKATPFEDRVDRAVFARFEYRDEVGEKEWLVTGRLARTPRGSVVIRSLEVTPSAKHEIELDVTSTVLRGIHLAAIRDDALRQLRPVERIETAEPGGWRRRGPTGFGDSFYEALSIAYLEKLDARTRAGRSTRGMLPELADEFGLKRTQIRDAVAKARKLGLLTPGVRGRAGADPGPRLRRPTPTKR